MGNILNFAFFFVLLDDCIFLSFDFDFAGVW